jgi:hypothetical protein
MSIGEQLAAWLTDELAAPVRIENLRRTTAGFSRENWVFDATWDGDEQLAAGAGPLDAVKTRQRNRG